MAKKKPNTPPDDAERYKKAAEAVEKLNKQIAELKKQLADIAADPWADPFADTATIEKNIVALTAKYEAAEKARTKFAQEESVKRYREEQALLDKQENLERAVWQKIIKEKADAEAKALAEAAKAEADAAKQAAKLADEQAKEEERAAKLAGEAKKRQLREEAAEVKRVANEKSAAIAAELSQMATADAKKKASAKEFQDVAKELFWTARYGGISGLLSMGLSRLVGGGIQGPAQPPVAQAAAPGRNFPTSGSTGFAPGPGGLSQGAKQFAGIGAADIAGGAEVASGAGSALAMAGPIAAVAGAALAAGKALYDLGVKAYTLAVQLSSLVAPGVTARHERATEDMWASIGVMLLPIVEHATNVLDKFNVLFTSLQGRVTPVVEKLATALEAVYDSGIRIVMMLDANSDTLNKIGAYLIDAANGVILFSESLLRGTAIMIEFFDRIQRGDLTGAANIADVVRAAQERANNLPGARTIAARQAQFTTVEGVGEQARLAAFSARGAAQAQLDESRQQTGLLRGIFNNTQPGGAGGASSRAYGPLGGITGGMGGVGWGAQAGAAIYNFIW